MHFLVHTRHTATPQIGDYVDMGSIGFTLSYEIRRISGGIAWVGLSPQDQPDYYDEERDLMTIPLHCLKEDLSFSQLFGITCLWIFEV